MKERTCYQRCKALGLLQCERLGQGMRHTTPDLWRARLTGWSGSVIDEGFGETREKACADLYKGLVERPGVEEDAP